MVASGVLLSKRVSLTLAKPFCPVSNVRESRSFGRMPSTLRDMNSPLQDCRLVLGLVMVSSTSTRLRCLWLERSMRAMWLGNGVFFLPREKAAARRVELLSKDTSKYPAAPGGALWAVQTTAVWWSS